jgi:hypothetical protein
MRFVFVCLLFAALALTGCRSSSDAGANSSASLDGQFYLISGNAKNPGSRQLHSVETVAEVISNNLVKPPGKPTAIALVRRTPEGKSRELIEVDAQGKLMDAKQDYQLRDQDELIFPSAGTP